MQLSPAYVTGLVESDGSFQIGFESGASTAVGFKINLRLTFF